MPSGVDDREVLLRVLCVHYVNMLTMVQGLGVPYRIFLCTQETTTAGSMIILLLCKQLPEISFTVSRFEMFRLFFL